MRFFKVIISLFLSVLFLTSCDFTGKDAYNEGYKAGYTEGFNAAVEKHKQLSKKEDTVPAAIPKFNPGTTEESSNISSGYVPQKAYVVLSFIREKDKAPDGYVGGRQFGNYERHLPERDGAGNKITYREWDIQPKIEGQNRGAQRLVTGSDGRAWYTPDHYNSFIEISTNFKK
jgi:guanyl-specific ribonuclease Sa